MGVISTDLSNETLGVDGAHDAGLVLTPRLHVSLTLTGVLAVIGDVLMPTSHVTTAGLGVASRAPILSALFMLHLEQSSNRWLSSLLLQEMGLVAISHKLLALIKSQPEITCRDFKQPLTNNATVNFLCQDALLHAIETLPEINF